MSGYYDTMGYHRATPADDDGPAEPPVDERQLDPNEAAALLDLTTRSARRQLDTRPPLLAVVGAIVVLVTYGAVWLSVRDQHPYVGPSGTALAVLYGTLVVWIVVNAVVLRRATWGVGGRAARERLIGGIAFAVIWISVSVFQGALLHAGASRAVVYGIYPAAGPLIIVGSAAAAYEAAKLDARMTGLALGAVVVGLGAAFAGPAGVWGVIGIGGAVLLLAYAAGCARLRRVS